MPEDAGQEIYACVECRMAGSRVEGEAHRIARGHAITRVDLDFLDAATLKLQRAEPLAKLEVTLLQRLGVLAQT